MDLLLNTFPKNESMYFFLIRAYFYQIISSRLIADLALTMMIWWFYLHWSTQRCLDERLGFSGICDSVDCIDISYRSVHSGNFSADPCQDFYHFACSKWQVQNPISDEQLYLAANINQLRDSVDSFLKSMLLLNVLLLPLQKWRCLYL